MPRVLGIDPSLSGFTIADAWLRPLRDGEAPVLMTDLVAIPAPPATQELTGRILRLEELARRAIVRIREAEPDAVFLEGYSYNSRGAVVLLGEFGGVFRCRLLEVAMLENGFPVYEVPPATLKKFATGKGNANKALVTSALAARFSRTFASDDEADAFGLSQLGLVVVGAVEAKTEAQREAAAAVLGNAVPRKKKGRKKKEAA